MNINAVIDQLSHVTGATRQQVIEAMGRLQNIPEVRRELERKKNGYDRRG